MYENPIVQDNLRICESYGMEVIRPDFGYLACGDIGAGKMPDPEVLFDFIEREVCFEKDLAGKKILVTAGPTREAIDPVRFITNHSTGKMGYAVAKAASLRGAEVTLVSGRTAVPKPRFVHLIEVDSAKEMFDAVTAKAGEQDAVIKAAAVADYRPKHVGTEKTKKKEGEMVIELERTDDILKWLGEHRKKGQFLCGFSMETQNMLENSRVKLDKKKIDMIVANNLKVAGAGFGTDTNVVTIITREKELPLETMTKAEVAHRILDEIFTRQNEGKKE
jgi:phosphopantothenoylcysteine decarboxylase/phosphopantothenate--cysteine ligase